MTRIRSEVTRRIKQLGEKGRTKEAIQALADLAKEVTAGSSPLGTFGTCALEDMVMVNWHGYNLCAECAARYACSHSTCTGLLKGHGPCPERL